MITYKTGIICFLFAVLAITSAFSQSPERKDVPDNYKWNLSDIYPTVEAWRSDVDMLNTEVSKVSSYKGKLGESADMLYVALSTTSDLMKSLYRAWSYASNFSNEDLNNADAQAMMQQMTALGTNFGEASSYMEPEILQIPEEKIKMFLKENQELANNFDLYIDNIQRLRAHTLTESEEMILASFGLISGVESDVYDIFTNAEKPFPKITLASGEEVELTPATFTRYRTLENRVDRAKVFETFFNGYGEFINTLGANLGGKVKKDWIYAKNRKYGSSLEAALNADNLPVSVYTTLIAEVNKNLPTLHRSLELKKRMLNLDQLHYYDLYVPLVQKIDMSFTVEQGQKELLAALKPLGEEYITTLQKAYDNRWIDYIPTAGKRSGAYSTGGAYDVHPYILMNWTDDYESVSTLAHELGHTMHSYFSNSFQPFSKADYATFVAEIASTVNETLLNNYAVKNAKSDEEKLYLLGSYLELLRTTIFRQTSFAEFEWEIHKKVEAGEPLTGEDMNSVYYDIVKRYYGNDEGVCVVDDYIQYEWSYIPHFIGYTYYVFQYSTSIIYGTAIVEKIIEQGQPAVDFYYNILKGGGSEYPTELIEKAGIDPMSSEPVTLTMQKMNKVMDEMEAILDKMGK